MQETASIPLDPTAGYSGGLEIPGWDLYYTGKVRDLYRHSSHPGKILMVATDRLSAFDVVMNETVPDRGRILTHIGYSAFEQTGIGIPCARAAMYKH